MQGCFNPLLASLLRAAQSGSYEQRLYLGLQTAVIRCENPLPHADDVFCSTEVEREHLWSHTCAGKILCSDCMPNHLGEELLVLTRWMGCSTGVFSQWRWSTLPTRYLDAPLHSYAVKVRSGNKKLPERKRKRTCGKEGSYERFPVPISAMSFFYFGVLVCHECVECDADGYWKMYRIFAVFILASTWQKPAEVTCFFRPIGEGLTSHIYFTPTSLAIFVSMR